MEPSIQELAYQKWQSAGCPSNEEEKNRFWLEAEQEILKQKTQFTNRWNVKNVERFNR
jgi:hypothetical protein